MTNQTDQFKCMPLTDMTLEEFKTWLSSNNVTVCYALKTPTYEKITNETLISQLEAISCHNGTNIFSLSSDNELVPEIKVSRLKELDKLV